MPFSLHERAYYSLHAVATHDARKLTSALEAIVADPVGRTDGMGFLPDGRETRICCAAGYHIYFSLQRDGGVFIHDILKP